MPSLKEQFVAGMKWTTLKTGFFIILGPLLQLVKARFLSAEDFAHIAIVMLSISLFKEIENFGMSQAVINRPEINREEASSVFFFNLFLSLFCGIALNCLAPLIANLFALPGLESYLRVVSIIVVVGGPTILFQAFLEKHLFFKELSLIEMITNIFFFSVVSLLLFMDFAVMAVIYGNLLAGLLTALLSAVVSLRKKAVRITCCFSFSKLRPFLSFGIYAYGRQMTHFLSHRLDEVIIGLFLAPEVLGFYYFGKSMLEKLRQAVTATFGKILYPTFAKLKNDLQRLSNAYLRLSKYVALFTLPLLFGVAATAHLFVPLLFGAQWQDSIIVFQIISLALVFSFYSANLATDVLYALDRPRTLFYIELGGVIVYVLSLYFLTPLGINTALIVILAYHITKTLILQAFATRALSMAMTDWFARSILVPGALALVMVVVVLVLDNVLTYMTMGIFIHLLFVVVTGAAAYLFLGFMFQREDILGLMNMVAGRKVVKKTGLQQ